MAVLARNPERVAMRVDDAPPHRRLREQTMRRESCRKDQGSGHPASNEFCFSHPRNESFRNGQFVGHAVANRTSHLPVLNGTGM